MSLSRVTTKHGMKARLVTPAQEHSMDLIADDVFTDPIAKVNVLGLDMEGVVTVYTTDGENHTAHMLISLEGTMFPL